MGNFAEVITWSILLKFPCFSFRGDSYQQRLYHQHIARSFRNLRRYRHIYGDSVRSIIYFYINFIHRNPKINQKECKHEERLNIFQKFPIE